MDDKINILLVDDHQMILDGMKRMFASKKEIHIVAEASNGQEAYHIIENQFSNIDLVITDISMPLLSGTDLCKMIKKNFAHIKVLVLSMYNSVSAVKESLLAEADGYLLKDAGEPELLTAVHRISAGGTYFSQDILPIMYKQYNDEKKQDQELSNLSDREIEVLKLIVQEKTSEEIGTELFISKKTVDNHRQNLLQKCNCKSSVGLVKFAIKNGLC